MRVDRRARPLALAGLALLCASRSGAAATPAPPCVAIARSLPEAAFPGQQIIWRLEILRREDVTSLDWLEPPAFPDFRAEPLPGRPEEQRVQHAGAAYLARSFERALFAERPGELLIAPKGLRCAVAGGAEFVASIPTLHVLVSELPAEGRPAGFRGLVGSLNVEVSLQPRALALGESARLELTLRGDANLWDAADPYASGPRIEGLELFPAPPELELEAGVQLYVRRRFAHDLVPIREGRIEIPAIRVAYFDPGRRAYASAIAPALALDVAPRAPARATPRGTSETPAEADAGTRSRSLGWWALGGLLAGAALGWSRRRGKRAQRGAAILAALEAASAPDGGAEQEAQRLARALRLALTPVLPAALSAPVEELRAERAADPNVETALALLAQAERARFDPSASPPRRSEVVAALEALSRLR